MNIDVAMAALMVLLDEVPDFEELWTSLSTRDRIEILERMQESIENE